jgi:HK97 family phage portal protein
VTTLVTGEGELREVNLRDVGPSTARWLPWPQVGGSVPFDPGWAGGWQDGWWGGPFAAVYDAQPEVRICVDFLARNIAQIGTKVLRRLADDDRETLYDHDLAETLRAPSPMTSRYWWQFGLVADLAIFDEAFNVIAEVEDRLALQRVPVPAVTPEVDGPGEPKSFLVRLGGSETRVPRESMFYVHGYNPSRVNRGSSPLDTLASLLREAYAAQAERTRFWLQRAHVGGVIERPVEAPKWSDPARDRFRTDWDERFSGPENAGKTPVLEDGMQYKPETFSPADSQWAEGRRLTREEVARAYHIPPPMVGILDHATFSNISEQHRMLYQDTLGPWLEMLTGEIERQLLPRFDDRDGIYVEFNVAAKLQGSFEQQVASISAATGRPWMTGNEGRSLMNLPRVDTDDMDEVVLPLNVTTTGPGSEPALPPAQPETPSEPGLAAVSALALPDGKAAERWVRGVGRARDRHATAYEAALRRHFQRQSRDVSALASDRWNRELSRALRGLHTMTAEDLGRLVAERFETSWDPALMAEWLTNAARIDAEGINATTDARVTKAVEDGADEAEAFADQTAWRVGALAATYATSYGMFGQREAATQGGLRSKVWVVTSPRSRHPSLNGQAVELDAAFSNGAQYPGDPAAGADQTSGCSCVMDYA